MPAPCQIELRLKTRAQLFNSFDPSPFTERDLDRDAAEFIVAAAGECHRREALALHLHVDQPDETTSIPVAIQNYFEYRAAMAGRELREHLRIARLSLVIGLAVLILGNLAAAQVAVLWPGHLGRFASDALLIGAWVAMWRPLELYLYDWWPIRRRQRLLQRLARAEVRVTTGG